MLQGWKGLAEKEVEIENISVKRTRLSAREREREIVEVVVQGVH